MLPISASAPMENLENSRITSMIMIQGNSLKGVANPENPLVFSKVLACLIEKESNGNENAYNPNDCGSPSFGCLQFKKKTFKTFCVDKYKLAKSEDEIWNCLTQQLCADRLIRDGYSNFWTTYKACLYYEK
jgi:hypothetical protein